MKVSIRATASRLGAASLAAVTAATALTVFPGNAAHADSVNRWATAGDYGRGYLFLEVLSSSTADLANVIAYPSNSGSANQYWSDHHISNGYYYLVNNNSGKVLDRWDSHTGPGSDGGCSTPMQYRWVNESQQYWRFDDEYSNYYGRWFNMWVNKAGCSGNVYQATLGVNFSTAANNGLWTTQFHMDRCVYGDNYGIYHRCYWRRNGEQ
ncbi:hypothetical protein GCM10010149_78420 [Nonomuraea roseoviolacea subsp. roseoviolacea]|uniref:Ricin B lectin domain-containing protein n=1 Tax=Nonomuraea roseoviolacea subsp. carminata TaxID=160689 RepID=A0ABT1K976_9ACTN|nr:RICIN domain-containing protein [Nonomuraea roseoviolacea]MCP2350500.1 hypothetical protein [Nonomuraea roseoviolacea subsp. carminata]